MSSAGPTTMPGGIIELVRIAGDLDAAAIAADARSVGERLTDERFFVAAVGEFKRGKSTLLNALVDGEVLPVGVPPVTTAVTVLRHGEVARAQVHFQDGRVAPVDVADLAVYVDDRHNPENAKNVSVAEVFIPARLLASGLCLVDTPGLGSVFTANTAATRSFLPQIDAALVVLGTDPPVSGEEADLVADIATDVSHLIVVLNKADRASRSEIEEARKFTAQVLERRLARSIGPVLEVSARERIAGGVSTRDWQALEEQILRVSVARHSVLLRARERAAARLAKDVRAVIAEREGALRGPIEATQAHVAQLRSALDRADRSLADLSALFISAEAALSRAFEERRAEFMKRTHPAAAAELDAALAAAQDSSTSRQAALRRAYAINEQHIRQFLQEAEPVAEKLYAQATQRFVQLANEFLREMTGDGGNTAALRTIEPGFQQPRRFFFASLMSRTRTGPAAWVADRLGIRRQARVRAHAQSYLAELLATNSMRVVNDFRDRVLESRRSLEAEVRWRLEEAAAVGERALENATRLRAAGAEAVAAELSELAAKRRQVDAIEAALTARGADQQPEEVKPR